MSAPIQTLLSRLNGVQRVRPNSWKSQCPAHNGDGKSLVITHGEDGRILIHCFAYQCDVSDILAAVSMSVSDLFPDRLPEHRYAPRKHGVSARDVLLSLKHEMLVVDFIVGDIGRGCPLDDGLRQRAQLAAQRIRTALALCDG